MAQLALEIRDAATDLRDPHGRSVPIRIGIASGPVVAGVVGTRKFFFDVCERLRDNVEIVLATNGSGRPIAGAFNLSSANALYGRYWGAVEEHPFLHFNVCYYHSIEQCIERKIGLFEPGAGGEHKRTRVSPDADVQLSIISLTMPASGRE